MGIALADCTNEMRGTVWYCRMFWWIRLTNEFLVQKMVLGQRRFQSRDSLMIRPLEFYRILRIMHLNILKELTWYWWLTSMMKIEISVRVGASAKEWKRKVWLPCFPPQTILQNKNTNINHLNFGEFRVNALWWCIYASMSVFVSIHIHHGNKDPIVIFSHLFDLWITWC